MELGYEFTIKQIQKLSITPQLIHAIQILQMNSFELGELVKDELLKNPVLEVEENVVSNDSNVENKESIEDIDYLERITQQGIYDDISYKQWQYKEKKYDYDYSYDNLGAKEETLNDCLNTQLMYQELSDVDLAICKFIIDSIDDNGYLTIEDEEIAKILNAPLNVVKKDIKLIQSFEPIGVCARSLLECLTIQLKHINDKDEQIVCFLNKYLKDIGNNKLDKIAKEENISIKEVKEKVSLLKSLNPKPGLAYSNGYIPKYIIPDVVIEKIGNNFEIFLNEDLVPHLMLNPYYIRLKKQNPNDRELNKYLNDKLDKALWLIDSIEQRKKTIFNVVSSILLNQIDFFNYGIKFLKKMTLHDIASELNVNESTVCRAVNGKYVETPYGIFELKFFFSSGLKGNLGESVSSKSVKAFIKEIIDSEDKYHPYSDQKIVDILSKKEIYISRRTVAKYRESMNIFSSRLRKEFKED